MTTVAEEDTSRAIWPSCPSGGWRSGVDTLWGLPNGYPLSASVSEERGTLGARITGKKTRALSAVAAAGTCTFVPGIDLDQGTMGPLPAPQVADEQACCDTCAANPLCYAAVFAGNQCWMKNQTQSMLPVTNDGVTACVQAGKPLPPLPPPTPPKYSTETHGPYQHGEGFPTVNSGGSLGLFNANLPPGLGPSVATGPSWWGTYASEFGGSVFSSFESMAPTLAPAHWGLHADPMYERNYAGQSAPRAEPPPLTAPRGAPLTPRPPPHPRALPLAPLPPPTAQATTTSSCTSTPPSTAWPWARWPSRRSCTRR
jgi:beta-mannosidase